ncbi:hypothetical protein [Kribbella sancticallisti]|uniref:hypothetical protein n=1 Tax=Kribbella sancticallisti TaxID=460087 RepID=UPI0031DA8361
MRRSYARLATMRDVADDELDRAIRAEVSRFGSAEIVHREDGLFEVTTASMTWLVGPDARLLFGVKRRPETPAPPPVELPQPASEHRRT